MSSRAAGRMPEKPRKVSSAELVDPIGTCPRIQDAFFQALLGCPMADSKVIELYRKCPIGHPSHASQNARRNRRLAQWCEIASGLADDLDDF
jgi:hypothetical protein